MIFLDCRLKARTHVGSLTVRHLRRVCEVAGMLFAVMARGRISMDLLAAYGAFTFRRRRKLVRRTRTHDDRLTEGRSRLGDTARG